MRDARGNGYRMGVTGLRVLFAVCSALVIAGAVLAGNYKDASNISTGMKLAEAGYILLAVVLAVIMGFCVYLFNRRSELSRDISMKVSLRGGT
ncbi:MAG: hypothetical protein INR71_12190 [Terriglobus roseus]|nr:hypothetical protein [Terriglobus roseus]